MRIWAGTLAVAIGLLGCDGDKEDSGDLVRYEVQGGEIDFEFEPQDTVVPIPDSLLVVQPDGQATYEFNNRPEIAFRLSDADLSKLLTAIDEIDFEEADSELSRPTEPGLPVFSVTHDRTTVDLGDKYIDINSGEGPAVADRMSELLDELDGVIRRAPGAKEAFNRYIRSFKND